MKPPDAAAQRAARLLARLREKAPRIHCISNAVAEAFTANVLLAAGAIPSMTINPQEVPDFVRRADGLLINLGTLDPLRRGAIDAALSVAREDGRSWVLDPVFVERSALRLELAQTLTARRPTVLRGNLAEITALIEAEANEEAVRGHARGTGTVIALTGATDFVTDGARSVRVSNGHPLMAHVTAMGCAASALMAGFLTVSDDPLEAAVACLATTGVAAEIAAGEASGPGSFATAYLDTLYRLSPEELTGRARIAG